MPVDKTRFTARQSSPSSRLSLPLAAARAPRRMRILRLVPVVFTQRHIPNVNPRPRASSSSPIVIASHRIGAHAQIYGVVSTAPPEALPPPKLKNARVGVAAPRRVRRPPLVDTAGRVVTLVPVANAGVVIVIGVIIIIGIVRPCSSLSPPGPPSPVSRLPSSSSFPGCSIHHPQWSRSLLPSTDRPFDRPTVRPTVRPPPGSRSSSRPSVRPFVRSSEFVRSTRRVSIRDSRNRTPHTTHTPRRRGFQKKRKKKPSASSCTSFVVVYLFVVV